MSLGQQSMELCYAIKDPSLYGVGICAECTMYGIVK